jgi:flagellar FliL protein
MATNEDDLELDTEGQAPEKPKSMKKFLMIGIGAVLLMALSAGGAVLVTGLLGDKTQTAGEEEVADEPVETAETDSRQPLNYIPLAPAFVVNFGDASDVRFLQVTIELGTRNPDQVEHIKEHSPALRNSVVMLLSSQDPATLNSREGKEKLRADTLAEVQQVMQEETGSDAIDDIFFTSFVMQ